MLSHKVSASFFCLITLSIQYKSSTIKTITELSAFLLRFPQRDNCLKSDLQQKLYPRLTSHDNCQLYHTV